MLTRVNFFLRNNFANDIRDYFIRERAIAFFLSLALGLFSSSLCAYIDPINEIMQKSYPPAISWKNISGYPHWVGGIRPELIRKRTPLIPGIWINDDDWINEDDQIKGDHQNYYTITLKPQEYVKVHLNRSRYLKISLADKTNISHDLSIEYSNGTGLYQQLPVKYDLLKKPLVITPVDTTERIVKITNEHDAQTITLALFASEHDYVKGLTPYRTLIPLSLNRVDIHLFESLQSEQYWLLEKQQDVELSLKGPARLLLESRLRYSAQLTPDDSVYHLQLQLDQKQWKDIRFDSFLVTNKQFRVNNQIIALGHKEKAFLYIPQGEHTLRIKASQSQYLRLLQLDESDYLFTELNKPRTPRDAAHKLMTKQSSHLDLLNNNDIALPVIQWGYQMEHFSQQWMLNGHLKEAIIDVAQLRLQQANNSVESPENRVQSELFLKQNTFYRQLLPVNSPDRNNQEDQGDRNFAFLSYELKGKQDDSRSLELIEPYFDPACQQLTKARFNTVFPGKHNARLYVLPERHAPSRIRLELNQSAMDKKENLEKPIEFFIQYDDRTPVRLRMFSEKDLPVHRYVPTVNEACVSSYYSNYKMKTVKPITIQYHIIDVATIELALPEHIQQIKVWRSKRFISENGREDHGTSAKKTAHPLQISLKYRASKQYKMDNDLYLQLITQQGKKLFIDAFIPYLLDKPISLKLADKHLLYLKNHWLDLKRYLLSQKKLFSADYYNERQPKKTKNPQNNKLVLQGLLNKTELSLLDIKILKGFLLDNNYYEDQNDIFNRLMRNYKINESASKILQLSVLRAFTTENPIDYAFLVNELAKQGKTKFALELGVLLMDYAESLRDVLVQSAYIEGNWVLFSSLVDGYKDIESIQYWRGYEAQNKGLIKSARNHWLSAGESGRGMINRLDKAIAIRELLNTHNREEQIKGYAQWMDWTEQLPGPKFWKNAERFVHHYLGGVLIYNKERDLYKHYFKGNKIKPVSLTLIGPAKLRFDVRLLHQKNKNTKEVFSQYDKNDWLNLIDNGQRYVTPLLHSLSSQGLDIIEQAMKIPGTLTSFYYSISAGEHHLTLYPQTETMLVSVAHESPVLEMPILPSHWNSDIVHELLGFSDFKPIFTPEKSLNAIPCLLHGCMYLNQLDGKRVHLPRIEKRVHQKIASDFYEIITGVEKHSNINHQPIRKTINNHFIVPSVESLSQFKLSITQLCQLSAAEKNRPIEFNKLFHIDVKPLNSAYDVSTPSNNHSNNEKLLSQTLFNSCDFDRMENLKSLMMKILWRYQNKEHERQFLLTLTETIISEISSLDTEIKKIAQQIISQEKWQIENSVMQSAGVRIIEQKGWQPFAKILKQRKAVMGQLDDNENILSDSKILGVSVFVKNPTEIQVDINKRLMAYQLESTVILRFQMDKEPWKLIEMPISSLSKKLQLPIGQGSHTFKFEWLNPVIGEYLGIKLFLIKDHILTPIVNIKKLDYHIATAQEPIKLAIEGPVQLRLDYQQNKRNESSFLTLSEGWQYIELKPINSQSEVLLRIYKRMVDNTQRTKRYQFAQRNISSLPMSQISNSTKDLINRTELKALENAVLESGTIENNHVDYKIPFYELFNQSDQHNGTFAASAKWTKGIDDELRQNETLENEYLELGVHHYLYKPYWGKKLVKSYFDSNALLRFRKVGEPTLGFKETLYLQPDWLFAGLRIDWKAYAQKQEATSSWAWSSNFRLGMEKSFKLTEKSSHIAKVSVFYKHHVHDAISTLDRTKIDPDVWSNYAEIHDKGLVIADTLYYYPWLDTQWRVGAALYSDEKFQLHNFEHISLKAGWKQLLGNVSLDLQYQWKRYFSQNISRWQRLEDIIEPAIKADVEWEYWQSHGGRLLAHFGVKYETEAKELSANFGMKWFTDNTRGYKDFRPHSLSFKHIRERERFLKNERN